jgi:cytochrome c biogenesis protein CcdA
MYWLIAILAILIPIFLLLVKVVFFGKPNTPKQDTADPKRRVDYFAWTILFVVGCAIVLSSYAGNWVMTE